MKSGSKGLQSHYDAQGRALTVTSPPRAGMTEDRTTTYAYHPTTGNLVSVTSPGSVTASYTHDVEGRMKTVTDQDGYTVTYDYDALDHLVKTTYPDGTYEQTQYESLRPVRRRDRLGRWSHTFYDAVGHVVSTRDPLGRTVTQEWCACGSLDKLIDPNGNATTWMRDAQGRVTKETRADGSSTLSTFEGTTSRLKETKDRKQQVKGFAYALDDTVSAITYTNAQNPTPNVSFVNDPAYKRLATMTDGTGTTSYSYQAASGRLASVDGPLANDTITYGYDELGRAVSRTLNAVTTTWAYDTLGRLTTLGDPIGNFTYGYVGSTGRVSSVTYPNGQTTSYAYLPVAQDLRLQEIHHKRPGGATLNKFNYTYDVVGDILTWAQQTDTNPAQTYTYEYDRADQLTAATLAAEAPKRYRYAYDPAGNRTIEQIDDAVTLSSHDNMNRLTTQVPGGGLVFRGTVSEPSAVTVAGKPAAVTAGNQFSGTAPVAPGATTVDVKATDPSGNVRTNRYDVTVTGLSKNFTYNPNGSLTSDGTKTYDWDASNKLIAVKQGGSTLVSFTYDASGRRVTKAVGGITTTYVYDDAQFLEERPSTGSTKRYVYGPGIDQPLAQVVVGGATTYNAADHLGSIVRTTDAAGNPTFTREYDPWGNSLQGANTSGYAYTGREWDPETSLYYYRARYYDPTLGRFLSTDPIEGSTSPDYAYVRNRPLVAVDPTGTVDLNVFSAGSEARIVADRAIPAGWGGVFHVAGHGMGPVAGGPIVAVTADARGNNPHNVKKLADAIRAKPTWKRGKPVKLWACWGGVERAGGGGFAQDLANELCSTVTAYTGNITWTDWTKRGYPNAPTPYAVTLEEGKRWVSRPPKK